MAYITKLVGTQKELAFLSQVGLRTITSLAAGKTNNRIETYSLLAKAAGVDRDWLMTGKGVPLVAPTTMADIESSEENFSNTVRMITTLPHDGPAKLGNIAVLGSAAGALAGSMKVTSEPIEWVRRPDGLAHVPDAYALYVVGNSMASRYLPGDVIFVHPHKPVRMNDVVIIQMQNGEGGEITTYLKVYGGHEGDEVHVKQYRDETKIRFKTAHIKTMHRVMTNNELYGL